MKINQTLLVAGKRSKKKLSPSKVDQDEEIVKAAAALLEKLKALPGGQQIIQQTVTGNQNIFSGTGNVNVTIGQKRISSPYL